MANAIRRSWLELARERFHLDVMEEAQKALPELNALERAKQDPQVTKYARARLLNTARRMLFGPNVPELAPETPEEEAAQKEAARLKAEEADRDHERMMQELRERTNSKL